ncbi:hypothetical protein Tco_0461886 [Tanacetum coccineum]
MSNELDLLFSLMFDELLNGTTPVVSKSSAVTTTDVPNQHQQQHITPSTSTTVSTDTPPLNIQITPKYTSQAPTKVPTVTANENIIQAQTNKEYAQVDKDEFINVFRTPVQEQRETSSIGLEQVIRNPSQSIRIRRQLETDGEMCMFALTVSRTEPKNIKEAMADSAWIEAMQEELHKFDRLDVWELVDIPLYHRLSHSRIDKSTSGGIAIYSCDRLMAFNFDRNTYALRSKLADMFTKAMSEDRFKYLVRRLGMRYLTPEELDVLPNAST